MNFLSTFSGIGGFDLAFQRAGMKCVGMVEIDKNCQSILHRHFPDVPIHDDVKKIGGAIYERGSIDVICGGFPCQDLSVAGKRAGLAGKRSELWFEFARIIDEYKPRWVVIENVAGLLSSNKGKDFAVILRWLAERGYGVAWRILDAQYFGVPQRRRRVFIVGSLGNGRAAQVLFESEGLSGNPSPSRKAWEGTTPEVVGSLDTGGSGGKNAHGGSWPGTTVQSVSAGHAWAEEVAPTLNGSGAGTSRPGGQGAEPEFMITVGALQERDHKGVGSQYVDEGKVVISDTVTSKWAKGSGGPSGNETGNMVIDTLDDSGDKGITIINLANSGSNQNNAKKTEIMDTIDSGSSFAVFQQNTRDEVRLLGGDGQIAGALASQAGMKQQNYLAFSGRGDGSDAQENIAPTLRSLSNENDHQSGAAGITVLAIDSQSSNSWKSKNPKGVVQSGIRRLTPTECERLQGFPDGWTDGQADTPRYKQLGNAVAVPVVEWIARRIMEVK